MQKQVIEVGQGTDGRPVSVDIFTLKGTNPNAPKVYIQAGMHGAELQGNAVIMQIIEACRHKAPLGDITLVPQCNPVAANHKVGAYTQGRFDAMSGHNWNRHYYFDDTWIMDFAKANQSQTESSWKEGFRTGLMAQCQDRLKTPFFLPRAEQLALHLQILAHQADVVLDLHTDADAISYVFAPSYLEAEAAFFDSKHIILMPNTFAGALDEAVFCPWWTVAGCFEQLIGEIVHPAVEAFTLELGSQECIDTALASKQAQGILQYLSYKGILSQQAVAKHTIPCSYHTLDQFKTLFAPIGGLYEWEKAPGEAFHAGEIIARCLQSSGCHYQNIQIPFDGILISRATSASIVQGGQLAKIVRYL